MNDQFLTPAQPPEAYLTAPQPVVGHDVLWTRLETEPVLRQWSREEYYRMGEAGVFAPDERVELIEGVIFQMPPQGPIHSTGTSAVQETLRIAFGAGFYVRSQMPLSLGFASDPEPDIAVVPGSFRDYRVAHLTTALLVVEVSDTTQTFSFPKRKSLIKKKRRGNFSSLNFDRHEKASLYARAGIQDYWIISQNRFSKSTVTRNQTQLNPSNMAMPMSRISA